jgi:hypothetical protein
VKQIHRDMAHCAFHCDGRQNRQSFRAPCGAESASSLARQPTARLRFEFAAGVHRKKIRSVVPTPLQKPTWMPSRGKKTERDKNVWCSDKPDSDLSQAKNELCGMIFEKN